MRKIILCCNKKGCPLVAPVPGEEFDGMLRSFKITDDFGGSVILTRQEIDMLVKEWSKEWNNTQKSDS